MSLRTIFSLLRLQKKETQDSFASMKKNVEIMYKYSVDITNSMVDAYTNLNKEFNAICDLMDRHTDWNPCKRCGAFVPHSWRSCPAKGANCFKCKKNNHFAIVCHHQCTRQAIDELFDSDDETKQILQYLKESTGIEPIHISVLFCKN